MKGRPVCAMVVGGRLPKNSISDLFDNSVMKFKLTNFDRKPLVADSVKGFLKVEIYHITRVFVIQ